MAIGQLERTMCVCVNMYACVCVCTHVCVCVCAQVHLRVWGCLRTCLYVCACVCAWACIKVYWCVCIRGYLHVGIWGCACVRVHVVSYSLCVPALHFIILLFYRKVAAFSDFLTFSIASAFHCLRFLSYSTWRIHFQRHRSLTNYW